jgi:hypothetical protein
MEIRWGDFDFGGFAIITTGISFFVRFSILSFLVFIGTWIVLWLFGMYCFLTAFVFFSSFLVMKDNKISF